MNLLKKKIKAPTQTQASDVPTPPAPQAQKIDVTVDPEEAAKSLRMRPPPDLEMLRESFQRKSEASQNQQGKKLVGERERNEED